MTSRQTTVASRQERLSCCLALAVLRLWRLVLRVMTQIARAVCANDRAEVFILSAVCYLTSDLRMASVHGGDGGFRAVRFEREKGIRWMPWHQEAMKDVARCEKPWGAASRL